MATQSIEQLTEISALSKAKGFLAREFLLWLWWRSEGGQFEVSVRHPSGKGQLKGTIWIDDRIVLESPQGRIHEHIMKGGTPAQSIEAAAALSSGKTVSEIRLGLAVEGVGEFRAILDGDELTPRSLKLPDDDDARGDVERQTKKLGMPLLVRLDHTRLFTGFIDKLFAVFLEERTSSEWTTKGVDGLRKWIKSLRTAASDSLH
jgi:hypothetical protein